VEIATRKAQIRRAALAKRRSQENKDETSRRIAARLTGLPEYAAARTVMFYLDARDEARTRRAVEDALARGKKIVVPYCVEGELELFHLERMDELEPGAYRILEPKAKLRDAAEKRASVAELDLIVTPGVAFDRRGGRLGNGGGYYDKLLRRARTDALLAALAFECQMFPEVPMQAHDVYMDKVVTETTVYGGGNWKLQTED
jgi:5-formyltetrahydrofolate cyclo-ligase